MTIFLGHGMKIPWTLDSQFTTITFHFLHLPKNYEYKCHRNAENTTTAMGKKALAGVQFVS
jgi:hypothetical protein